MRREPDKTNPNKLRAVYYVNLIMLCIVTVIALAAAIFLFVRLETLNIQMEEMRSSQANAEDDTSMEDAIARAQRAARGDERRQILLQIQSAYESGYSTTMTLRSLFPDDIVVYSGGRYFFYPVQSELASNVIASGDLVFDENNTVSYAGENENLVVHQGIDVSSSNGVIDWAKVAEESYTFAMLRIGYKNSDGKFTEDPQFENNLRGSITNGLKVGCYVDLKVDDEKEAVSDASFIVERLSNSNAQIEMPVAIRLEVPDEASAYNARTHEEWTACVLSFCKTIEKAGYKPMIYGNIAAFQLLLNLDELEAYEKWIADYSGELYFPYHFDIWQYSISGSVGGVNGTTALNVYVEERSGEEQ